MSIRYGVSLLADPDFTARAYRARQLICGQYGCWAAEMHSLRMPLSDYFALDDDSAGAGGGVDAEAHLAGEVARLAERYRRVSPRFPLFNRGITATRPAPSDGNIWVDFSPEVVNESLYRLQSLVADLLERNPAVDKSGGGSGRRVFGADFPPQIALLSHADLPDSVFDSALEFARAVTDDLKVSQITRAWQVALTRFRSDAAGEDWSGGRWAADLQWRVVGSYSL